VRSNDKYINFHWDSWWSQAIPILKVMSEVITPRSEKAKSYCEKDEELEGTQALVNSYGAQIEIEVQKNDSTFNWDSWWRQSKPILTEINQVFISDPKHLENVCKE
ncbi:hypothetical protein, partial [Klebsiella pneumoniae]|uniref:hypothetical protein n=1 Tax=Klebsiella pneumoniae TaxID=573 RepID=UPI0024DEB4D1